MARKLLGKTLERGSEMARKLLGKTLERGSEKDCGGAVYLILARSARKACSKTTGKLWKTSSNDGVFY